MIRYDRDVLFLGQRMYFLTKITPVNDFIRTTRLEVNSMHVHILIEYLELKFIGVFVNKKRYFSSVNA